ncbi:unnamed protein product [Amoebophrya sp. A25]|nr:unnamed protein product [Amoebophrya sp. A25]|eukprot:GSA25T00016004001.1
MTDERGPQSKTTEAYRRYLETADFLQEGLYGMPPLAAQESTSDGYWLGTAAPLYSHAQMIGAMGFSEHVLPPPPPPPGKGFHLPAPPGIVPGSAASSLEAILGQSVTHRVAKPPPPPPGLAVAGQPPNPKAPFVPQATARIPPQMYENGPPERTKGSRNEWPRDPAYRPRDAHSIKGKDHPHAGSSSCVVEDVRRAGKPGKNKGAWDPYPLPLWGTGKPAGRHHQKQPTPTEAYDLGMERTMDGGKMDPRKSTPPHLLYNKAHANDKRTPGDLLSPVATSIMSPLIPSPDLAHHQLHASGKAGQQYASQQVVATPVEVPSNGNPTSQQYHAPVLSLSSSAGGEQIKGGAPAPAVDISHCSAEDAGGAAASGGGGCGVTTARGGAYGTAAARGVETGYPTGKGGPASSKGPIKGDVPPITEGYSSASGSNAAARRSTTSSCSNTGGSYSYGASAARSSSGFASASATTTSGFVPGGTTSKMRLNGAPGTSSAHSQKSEGVRPRSSIISGLLPQRWQSWMFGQEEVEDATRGHKSQSIITTTVSAARSGDVDDERNFDGVDDPQHQLLPKATSRTSVLAPFEAASLGQHSREDLNHVSENGGQADLVIKESQQSSSACSSENSCATRVAPEDLPKGVHYATAYTQNRNYSGFQPREEPTVLQDTLRYCPRRLATIENDTKWARDSKVTTVMIRNIPNRYTTEDVLQEIDGRGFYKNYNYFYLPIDFGNKVNMGYAFLNFLAPKHVERFAREFHDTKLPKYATSKILEICAAGKQGLEENVARFLRRDTNRIQNPFFLPLVFGWSSKSEWQAYPLTRENLIKITTRAKEVARELTKKRAAAASTGGQDEMPQAKNDRESKK